MFFIKYKVELKMRIEKFFDAKNNLGEGPIWDVETKRLYWIDSLDMKIFRISQNGKNFEECSVPKEIGSIAITKNDDIIIASLADGLYRINFSSGYSEQILELEKDLTFTRLNDGKVDKKGRFIVGSMDRTEKESICGLYQISPDYSYKKIENNIIVSNGPCWSPTGEVFYFADSWTRKIVAYDYDIQSGSISGKRDFVSTSEFVGGPDGATVDAEGYVWSAICYSGFIIRCSPRGEIVERIKMPVKKVTSVMFGGENLDILFVTTMGKAGEKYAPNEPDGGSIFAIHDLGIKGIPETRFGGI